MANDPEIQFLVNLGGSLPGSLPGPLVSLNSPFTKNSTTGKIQLQTKSGETYDLLHFIRFNDAALDFYEAAQNLNIKDLDARKKDFAKTFMIFEVVAIAATNEPATITPEGILSVQSSGNFIISVRFDPAAVNAYNSLAEENYQKRIDNLGFGNIDRTRQSGEKLLQNIPTIVESTSDPLGAFEEFANKTMDSLKNLGEGVIDGVTSVTEYLTKLAIGATEEFNNFLEQLRDAAASLDPGFAKLLEDEISKIKNKIKDNQKSSWIGGLIGIDLTDIPVIGGALDLIEKNIIAAVTIGQQLTGSITNLAQNLVREAFNKIEDFLNIDDKLLGIAATVLGTDVRTIKKVLTVIKDIQRIQTLLTTGNIGEAADAIKDALLENADALGYTRAELDKKIDSLVNSAITFVTGNVLDFLFPSKKGLSVSRDFKMSTNSSGILTINNPKELGNNLQVTEIILKNVDIDGKDIIIDTVEIISGGNFSVMNSETDEDDAIDFEAEIPIIISPGQSAQIKINFRNPDKLEGILSIDSEFTYLGLKPDEQINSSGQKIINQTIDEGDDLEETYKNQSVTPGSNKKITQKQTKPDDVLQSIQDEYAKVTDSFSRSQRLLNDKNAALEEAKKVGGQALLDASKDLQDAQKQLDEARKKLEEVKKKLDDALSTVKATEKAIDDFKKKTFMDALNSVDFKKLPPELAALIQAEGVKLGITEEDITKYYEQIEEGVKKVNRARDLIGKNNPIWNNLKKYQQASLAERLKLTWQLLNDTIKIHNGMQDIFGDPKNNIPAVADPVTALERLTQEYKEKFLQMIADGIKVNGKPLVWAKLDEAAREALAIGVGIYPDPTIKDPKKRYADWMKRIKNFFDAAEKVKEIQRKRENLRNEIVKRTNKEREKARNRKENKTDQKTPVEGGNNTKSEEKKINRPKRGKPITGVGDKIYRIDPIVPKGPGASDERAEPIQIKELTKEVTVTPVPEMAFYEDEFRTHYESIGITPENIQDIYDNAEQIVADPIMDLKDNIEDGNTGAVKGFITPSQNDDVSGTAGSSGTDSVNIGTDGTGGTGGTGGSGGTSTPEGVTGFREFQEGEEGRDYGTYIVYTDETKTKFSVDGQTLETPFLYAIYRYVLCSNDTPETSKSRAKANILKVKDELNKNYFYQGTLAGQGLDYIGDDSCPPGEIQVRLVPTVGPNGDIILKREASERKIRTGVIEAENTYIDSNGKIQEAPASINESNQSYQWRDKAGIQQPIPFVYPEDEENVITYDPSLFEAKDPQNDAQKSIREKIMYLLQTGGMSASRISFDILTDGSVVWDGEIKINKKGLTGDGKIPIKFAVVNGKFDCSGLNLTTLENSPKMVYGEFNCSDNNLTTLENGPIAAVSFVGDNNPLGDGTGLKYGPTAVIGWPTGTIINGTDGYIYSCANCKLENLQNNGLTVFGNGGINLSKNKLKSLEEISEATNAGILSLDISDNEFESLDSIPPIKSLLAFDENWLDYESKAFYRNPLNAPNGGEMSYGTDSLQRKTTASVNNFIVAFNNKTKNLVKPNSGTTSDMNIKEFLSDAKLPKSESDKPQKPRASIEEIKSVLSNLKKSGLTDDINYPCIVSIRNYFSGLPEGRNTYRDAMFLLVSPTEMYSYNANTLPTKSGMNPEINLGYPVLQPGKYIYTLGKHNGSTLKDFPALVQQSVKNFGDTPNNRDSDYLKSLFIVLWKAAIKDKNVNNSSLISKLFSSVDPNNPDDINRNLNIGSIFGHAYFTYKNMVPQSSLVAEGFLSAFESLKSIPYVAEKINEIKKESQYKLPNTPFVFIRDGQSNAFVDYLGIVSTNLHPGGFTDTWSIGCQTIPYALKIVDRKPVGTKYNQWDDFYKRARSAIEKRNGTLNNDSNLYDSIEYILVENPFKMTPNKQVFVPGQIKKDFDLMTKYPKTIGDLPKLIF